MNAGLQFAFERPQSLAELGARLAQLSAAGADYVLAAGATDLMPQLKLGLRSPQRMISLGGLSELRGIAIDGDGRCRIGALTSLATIAADARLQALHPALTAAVARVASAPIRSRATLGGNVLVDNRCSFINQSVLNRAAHRPCFKADGEVCHIVKSAQRGKLPQCQARFVSDSVPVLLLLDAELRLWSPRGERRVALAGFHHDDGIERHDLARDEVLVAIELPAPTGRRIDYAKLAVRANLDFPSLGVALGLRAIDDDAFGELAVALTGIGTHPGHWRHRRADFPSAAAMLDAAVAAARDFAASYDQDFFPRDYRKRMIEVFIRRAAARLGGAAWT